MRMKSVFGVFAIVLCLPAAAFAQDRKLFGEVGIGPTFLFGESADLVNTGFNFDLGATYMATPMFGVKIDMLASWTSVKDSVTANLNVGEGNALVWVLSGSGVVSSPIDRRVSGYGVIGGGIYYRKVELTNPGTGVATICDPWLFICYPSLVPVDQIVGERSSWDFGMNVGGGVNFRFGDSKAFFVESRYHYVWGPTVSAPDGSQSIEADGKFLPLVFGVRF